MTSCGTSHVNTNLVHANSEPRACIREILLFGTVACQIFKCLLLQLSLFRLYYDSLSQLNRLGELYCVDIKQAPQFSMHSLTWEGIADACSYVELGLVK